MRISDWSSDVCSADLLAVGGATGGRCLIRNLPWLSAFLHNPASPERRRHGQDQAYSNHTDGRLRLRRAKRLWRRRDCLSGRRYEDRKSPRANSSHECADPMPTPSCKKTIIKPSNGGDERET